MKLYRPFIITIFIILMISPYITAKDDDIDNLEYQVYKAVIEQGYGHLMNTVNQESAKRLDSVVFEENGSNLVANEIGAKVINL